MKCHHCNGRGLHPVMSHEQICLYCAGTGAQPEPDPDPTTPVHERDKAELVKALSELVLVVKSSPDATLPARAWMEVIPDAEALLSRHAKSRLENNPRPTIDSKAVS